MEKDSTKKPELLCVLNRSSPRFRSWLSPSDVIIWVLRPRPRVVPDKEGSMARFSINGNYMYVVDHKTIKVYGIEADQFEHLNDVTVDFGLETIFARGEYLYLGAADAMYIYSIADPAMPAFIFRYTHIVACDPVVVQGNRAYVTLRGGNGCFQQLNALDIIDISDPYNPFLIASHPMDSPHGLGIDGKLLFICDGESGLKVFDVTDEYNLNLVHSQPEMFAYDVILRQGLATVTGEDGIFQFSYNENDLTLVSTIPVLRAGL